MAQIDPSQYYSISAGFVPRNLNQKTSMVLGIHVKGGHNYPYLKAPASDPAKWNDTTDSPVLVGSEPVDPNYLPPYRLAPGLLDLHPNRMVEHMQATVKVGFRRLLVILTKNPDFIQWGAITTDNWLGYWEIIDDRVPDNAQIIEFASDYDGSIQGWPTAGRPPYDDVTGLYPQEAESLWSLVEDQKRHRWYRIKYLDFDENNDPVVGYITPPIPRGALSTTFVTLKNRYIRNGIKDVDDVATSRPPRPATFLSNGAPNNEPSGTSSDPMAGDLNKYLWVTRALIELSGNIITSQGWSEFIYIEEDIETVRYSVSGKPDPNTIVGPTEDVATGTNNADLTAAGWVESGAFDPNIHNYIATRTGSSGNWSSWRVEQIRDEEGLIIRRRFKLFPITTDYDDPTWRTANKPIGLDIANQGWTAELQTETPFMVNFVSEGTFYQDGTIKADWSYPKPFTSLDVFEDYIELYKDNAGAIDTTKYADDTILRKLIGGVVTHDPAALWLRAELFKGNFDMHGSADYAINYQWYKIYNNGQFLTEPEDLGIGRAIRVSHEDVTGRAIFQVTMEVISDDINLAIGQGLISGFPTFVEEISIKDQVDGRDGRVLSATATKDRFLLLTTPDPDELSPSVIIVRAEVDNVLKSAVEWYYLDGTDPLTDDWVEIDAIISTGTSSPKYTYKNANNDLVLVGGPITTATDIFDLVGSEVYIRAYVPAADGLPALEDWVMINKTSDQSLVAGEPAFDVHIEGLYFQVQVDEFGDFVAGELTEVLIKTQVRKGNVVKLNNEYTVSNITASGVFGATTGITASQTGGAGNSTYWQIVVNESTVVWNAEETKGLIEFDVTLGSEVKHIKIGFGTTLEPTGYVGLNLTSSRGTFNFDYSEGGSDDIILTASLVKHTENGNEAVTGYKYAFILVGGNWDGYSTNGYVIQDDLGNTLTVPRSKVNNYVTIQAVAYKTGTAGAPNAPYYTDTVRINDMPDTRTRLVFNRNSLSSPPIKFTGTWATAQNNHTTTGSWYKVSDGLENWYCISADGGLTWVGPYQLRGTQGVPGVNGSLIYVASGLPSNSFGNNNDLYLRTDTGGYYHKVASVWQYKGQYVGTDGTDGADGEDGVFDPNIHFWDTAWVSVVPTSPYQGIVKYRRDKMGRVHLKGTVSLSSFGPSGLVMTLPAGFRPAYKVTKVIASIKAVLNYNTGTQITVPYMNLVYDTDGRIYLTLDSLMAGQDVSLTQLFGSFAINGDIFDTAA